MKIKFLQAVFLMGVGIVLAVALPLVAVNKLKQAMASPFDAFAIIYMIVALTYWLLMWVGFAFAESEEIEESIMDGATFGDRFFGVIAAFLVSVFFSLMFAFITSLLVLASIYLALVVTAMSADIIIIRRLNAVAFRNDASRLRIASYYKLSTHVAIHVSQIFVGIIVILAYIFLIAHGRESWLGMCYCLLATAIVVHETIYLYLRWPRLSEKSPS